MKWLVLASGKDSTVNVFAIGFLLVALHLINKYKIFGENLSVQITQIQSMFTNTCRKNIDIYLHNHGFNVFVC